MGVVKYCPEIFDIWNGMHGRFTARGVDLDFVTFESYESQNSHLIKKNIDIAWNGPLAHVRLQKLTQSVSLGMRDVDRDFSSILISNRPFRGLKQMHFKTIYAGTVDSPQAYILPFHFLKTGLNIDLETLNVIRFDRDIGKHGDTALGEIEVLKNVHKSKEESYGFVSKMEFDRCSFSNELNILHKFPGFDHCQFDCLASYPIEYRDMFQKALFSMDMNNEFDARVMKMEGIRSKWEQPRESGYNSMREALALEKNVEFPPLLHTIDNHPFHSLKIQ